MTMTNLAGRDQLAKEYLRVLKALTGEMKSGMNAVAGNSLVEFEESVSTQIALSGTLGGLVSKLCNSFECPSPAITSVPDKDLRDKICSANDTLQKLNTQYAALLTHCNRSVQLMISTCRSFAGELQEDSGTRFKQQTWSCRI